MSDNEKLFYCLCIRANKYRYSYGRQANKTLGDILIPERKEIPSWVYKTKIPHYPPSHSVIDLRIDLNVKHWKTFRYDDIFEIQNGYYNKKPPESNLKEVPFIGASEFSNGVTSYHSFEDIQKYERDGTENIYSDDIKLFEANCITVANNGNSVASAFYQPYKFSCTHDINVLRLKRYKMTKYIAIFLCTLIKMERYRWSYGRKWRPKRMPESEIKLPVDKNGNPDWNFMENYVKSLPYSASI